MIVMSGNWWAPEKVGVATCTPISTDECTNPAAIFDATVDLRRLDDGPDAQQMTLRRTLFFAGDAVCGERDLWKASSRKVQYRNESGSLDAPGCTPGSANGLATIQYRVGSDTDVPFAVRAKRSNIGSPVGPGRLTLVLGDSAAAGDAGECGVSGSLACTVGADRATCR